MSSALPLERKTLERKTLALTVLQVHPFAAFRQTIGMGSSDSQSGRWCYNRRRKRKYINLGRHNNKAGLRR
jgi:hypothetical protein